MIQGEWMTMEIEKVREYSGPDGTVIQYEHATSYEIRSAPDQDVPWSLARKVGETSCGLFRTQDFCYGSNYYQVRARSLWTGQLVTEVYDKEPSLISTSPPGDHLNVTNRDEQTEGSPPGWPGTIAGGTTGANAEGNLALFATGSSGTLTYTTPEFDLGFVGRWHFAVCLWPRYDDHTDTWEETDPTDFWTDDEDWTTGETDALGEPIPDEQPWDDSWVQDGNEDWIGDPDDPPISIRVESSVHEVQGAGTFEEHRPGVCHGRYAQVRVTFTGKGVDTGDIDVSTVTATVGQKIRVATDGDHGREDGNSVTIFGVGGVTDANGTFVIEYVDTDEFDLVGTIGDGSSYTSGGVVITGEVLELAKLVTQWSAIPEYKKRFDVTKYGAVDGDTSDAQAALNTIAIQAACDAAAAQASLTTYGGEVYVPRGEYYIDGTITLGNRVWMVGDNSFASRLVARASTFTGNSVIDLGGGAEVYNCRIWRLGVDAGDQVQDGVYSYHCAEQSGCFDFQVLSYTRYGVNFEKISTEAASECGVSGFEIAGADTGTTAGIRFGSMAGIGYIKHGTVNWRNSGTHVHGILIDGGNTEIYDVHVEHHTNGITVQNSAIACIQGVYGATTVTGSLINVASGAAVTLLDINRGSATSGNILTDANYGVSWAYTHTPYIPFYSTYEVHIGPMAIQGVSQTAKVDLGVPDCAGVAQDIVTTKTAAVLEEKSLVEPIIQHTGQTAAQKCILDNTNQQIAGNSLAIPNLGDDGGSPPAAVAREILVNQREDSASGDFLWQEARSLRLVDCQLKRNGQTGNFARLGSANQTGSPNLYCPDLLDSGTHYLSVIDLAETFSAVKTFTAGPGIRTAGSYSVQLLNTSESAARTATIPLLGGDRTFAMIDIDQTFTGANEFTGQITIDKLNFDDPEAVQLASDVAAITKSYVIIEAETGTVDTVTQITGGVNNMLLVVGIDSGDTITFEHLPTTGDGYLKMQDDGDYVVTDDRKRLMFIRHHDGSNYYWHEIGRG